MSFEIEDFDIVSILRQAADQIERERMVSRLAVEACLLIEKGCQVAATDKAIETLAKGRELGVLEHE